MSDLSDKLVKAATSEIPGNEHGLMPVEYEQGRASLFEPTENVAARVAVAMLRVLATDADRRGEQAHRAAMDTGLIAHRDNFLGERAAEYNAAQRFLVLAREIEEAGNV